MSSPCDRLREHVLDLRGSVPVELIDHILGCDACRELESGARSLRNDLDSWEAADPPPDLTERTLARLALASASPEDTATPKLTPSKGAWHSVELLTTSPLSTLSDQPVSHLRLVLRLCAQAAAAVLLFGVCTVFVAIYYPAVVHALEERDVRHCQERLRVLGRAAVAYRNAHPREGDLKGSDLRRALLAEGFVQASDLVCPAGEKKGYMGDLPSLGDLADHEPQPVYWDSFGNHSSGINVIYHDGQVELVEQAALGTWFRRAAAPAETEQVLVGH